MTTESEGGGVIRTFVKRLFLIASTHGVGGLVRIAGVLGVPILVVALTGGAHTIAYWIVSVLSLCGVAVVAALIGLQCLTPLVIIYRVLTAQTQAGFEKATNTIWHRFAFLLGVVLFATVTGVLFVTQVEEEPPPGTRLPLSSDNLGTLIVLYGAFALVVGLTWLGGRLSRGRTIKGRAGDTPPVPELASVSEPFPSRIPPRAAEPFPSRIPPRSAEPFPPRIPPRIPEPAEPHWSFQAVQAWRAWWWRAGSLHGVVASWPGPEFVASCDEPHEVPDWNHRCGIYGVKEASDVFRFPGSAEVVGLIEMWGDVIEHDRGYRASHARIVELWAPSRIIREVRERYPDVTVHLHIEGSSFG